MATVYQIANTENGKFYVGSTVNVKARFRTHRRDLAGGSHHCEALQRAWCKYGQDAFAFTILEDGLTPEEARDAENRWLIDHQGKPHCYNTGTRAGAAFLGRTHSATAKAKLSETHKGKKHRLGHTNSPEHRARQSASMRGIKKSPEHVEKIRQRMLGQTYSVGRIVSDAERAAKGYPVEEVTTGVQFISVTDAARHFGLQRVNVTRTLRNGGVVKRGPRKGLHFRYVETCVNAC